MSSSGISAPGGPQVQYSMAATDVGYPHFAMKIAGRPVHVTRWSLSVNAHGATNEGEITSSLLADGDWSAILHESFPDKIGPDGNLLPGAKLTAQDVTIKPDKVISATIDAGFLADAISSPQPKQLIRLFTGIADSYRVSFRQGTITFLIRSLAAYLTQMKIQTSVENMTTVEFVRECAALAGLPAPDIQLRAEQKPATLQEVYAQREMVGVHNVRRWDMLKYCAQVDDVQLWESNGIVHYVQPAAIQRKTLELVYGTDLIDLDGEHSITFNHEIHVEVHSNMRRTRESKWTRITSGTDGMPVSTSGSSIIKTQSNFGSTGSTSTSVNQNGDTTFSNSSSSGGSANSGVTGTQENESTKERYVFDIPNLSIDGCNKRAIAIWRQISMHEYQSTFSMPVTSKNFSYLDVTTFFKISGSPYKFWNQKFWPRAIRHECDLDGGWHVSAEAVNHFLAEAAV